MSDETTNYFTQMVNSGRINSGPNLQDPNHKHYPDPKWKGTGIDYAQLELRLRTPEQTKAERLDIQNAARAFHMEQKLGEASKEDLDALYIRVKLESFGAVYGSRDVGQVLGLSNPQPISKWEVAALGARCAISWEFLRRKEKAFHHDCGRCVFLGPYADGEALHDLYVCTDERYGLHPTVIARHGEDGNYSSGLETARRLDWYGHLEATSIYEESIEEGDPKAQTHPLVVAMHRAVVFGLLPSTEDLLKEKLEVQRERASHQWNRRSDVRQKHGVGSVLYRATLQVYLEATLEVERTLIKLGRQRPTKNRTGG